MSLLDLKVSYGDLLVHGGRRGSDCFQLWRTDDFSHVASVMHPWAEMGGACAVDPINQLLISGTWTAGLTCFDYRSRKILWSRPDILGIHTVEISSAFPGSVFVAANPPQEYWHDYQPPDPNGIMELDIETGKMKWLSERGYSLRVHPTKPVIMLEDCSNFHGASFADVMQGKGDTMHVLLDGNRNLIGAIPKADFPIVDAGFAGDKVALAEGRCGVRVLDLAGRLISHYLPTSRKPNCIRAVFNTSGLLIFDSWEGSYLTQINPSSAEVLSEYERQRHDHVCFVNKGAQYIDQAGLVYNSSDGILVGSLEGV